MDEREGDLSSIFHAVSELHRKMEGLGERNDDRVKGGKVATVFADLV